MAGSMAGGRFFIFHGLATETRQGLATGWDIHAR